MSAQNITHPAGCRCSACNYAENMRRTAEADDTKVTEFAAHRIRPGIGMPTAIYLDEFGQAIRDAFPGHTAYHVGSSLCGKQWRDVDVRLMLDDETYERMGLGDPAHPHQNAKWVALVKAFSALAREMTGLPVDFQIQQQTRANAEFNGPRSALGVHAYFRTHPQPLAAGPDAEGRRE